MDDDPPRLPDYHPHIDPNHWAAIRDFVHTIVQRANGKVTYGQKVLQWAVSEFALWAWQDAGLPLEAEDLFDRTVISYYVQVGCGHLTAAARGNRRSVLLRIAELLDLIGPSKLPPLPPSDPSKPYTRKEAVSIISWARAQSTSDRRRNAHVLVALGLGAGLSAQEIIGLRGHDIIRAGSDIDISVGSGRTRAVPMLHEFVDLVPDDDARLADAYAFRPGRTVEYVNAISNFVARGHSGGMKPTTQRMRATWIVRHLDAGTPLPALVQAAGLESLDALARFERFAQPIPAATAARYLRFAEPGD
ncbi:hypothetical protein [Curtobacterium flaccumfaciens]|uniref:hypothetical protein n=1 Tax=Curtobacterium flaccumfaciens TaxID=2035 RepID=UPI002202CC34|nr:hypothetical protein [Curtobacterium flaccumfaciens]UWD79221.1 hypothetical protein NY058_00135 [Curtobacterium flaccumfaciens]